MKTNLSAQPKKIVPDATISSWLSEPTWSVKSMLPTEDSQLEQVSKKELHHLLKLSALEQPKTQQQEEKMLKTLQTQLHFVKQVQTVDARGVEPLVAIRDETQGHIQERTVTLNTLKPFLAKEDQVGKNGTVRRRKATQKIKDSGWNPFDLGEGNETRKDGRFFFVKKVKANHSIS